MCVVLNNKQAKNISSYTASYTGYYTSHTNTSQARSKKQEVRRVFFSSAL